MGSSCAARTEESTHFLENVVSANTYVPAVPAVAAAAHRARRIGLGIMGLGDMMYLLGIRYGSEEGQEFAAQIMEFVRYQRCRRALPWLRRVAPSWPSTGASTIPNSRAACNGSPPRP